MNRTLKELIARAEAWPESAEVGAIAKDESVEAVLAKFRGK